MPEQSANVQRAVAFFAKWSVDYDAMCASYHDIMTPDCVWVNAEFPPTYGPEEAVKVGLEPVREKGMETIPVDIVHIGEDQDGRVWSERVDHVVHGDGSVGFSVPVVGVMEFDDTGRVRSWREYFDPSHIVKFMEETEWLPADRG